MHVGLREDSAVVSMTMMFPKLKLMWSPIQKLPSDQSNPKTFMRSGDKILYLQRMRQNARKREEASTNQISLQMKYK